MHLKMFFTKAFTWYWSSFAGSLYREQAMGITAYGCTELWFVCTELWFVCTIYSWFKVYSNKLGIVVKIRLNSNIWKLGHACYSAFLRMRHTKITVMLSWLQCILKQGQLFKLYHNLRLVNLTYSPVSRRQVSFGESVKPNNVLCIQAGESCKDLSLFP